MAVATSIATLDPEFLNPFISATRKVFETQVSMAATPGKPEVKKAGASAKMDITGVINMNCKQFNGSIAICFPKSVFLGVYDAMLGEKVEEIDEEVADCAGELLNIIYGTAKTTLNAKGYEIEKAIPAVMSGGDINLQFKAQVPTLVIPFKCDAGVFWMEIIIDPS